MVLLHGLPLVAHAVRGLLDAGCVRHVVVAAPADHQAEMTAALSGFGPVTVVTGGADRTASVRLALRAALEHVPDARIVLDTPSRTHLRAVQTPQGFDIAVLLRAYEAADGTAATDDAGLVERIGVPVHTVPGDVAAMKITTPFDLAVAEAVFAR
jgi:2-C-methyl-D-erythritol 4-phosphate cytidylyltransferase